MKTVFVNGCFDILHRGHLELFAYARSLGDHLTVGIDTDERVRELKGPKRPINSANDRAYILSRLQDIDQVRQFNSGEELENLIKELTPDIMVVGSDWHGKEIVGGHFAKEIRYFKRIDGYSTTRIIEGHRNR